MPLNVLILGGSSEATALANGLARDPRFDAVLSLAGRTRSPARSPLPWRVGGFGGVQGLIDYLAGHRIDALVVALHPFATQMRRHAVTAVRARPTPLVIVDRPPWTPQPGDRWIVVPDLVAAAMALGQTPQRVLLTTGRQDLGPFANDRRHAYLIRSIDPPSGWPDGAPVGAELVLDRGPFTVADERRLMVEKRIDIVVTKNAGGDATRAKLAAAASLGLKVVMVDRPPMPDVSGLNVQIVADATAALDWLSHQALSATDRGV